MIVAPLFSTAPLVEPGVYLEYTRKLSCRMIVPREFFEVLESYSNNFVRLIKKYNGMPMP